MLDELLEKKLKGLKNEDILVVMDDGLAFLGELVEFDNKTLVLKKVYQAPAKSIDWKELPSKSDDVKEGPEKKREVGFIDWTNVNLEEIYIRLDHTTRIWRWPTKEKEEENQGRRDFKRSRRPVYTRGTEKPDERYSSIGDIPDKFPG
ncbi:MAG: hypothetical protein V5A66_04100 [Candidatus Thermoplasmatota archaeon]